MSDHVTVYPSGEIRLPADTVRLLDLGGPSYYRLTWAPGPGVIKAFGVGRTEGYSLALTPVEKNQTPQRGHFARWLGRAGLGRIRQSGDGVDLPIRTTGRVMTEGGQRALFVLDIPPELRPQ